MHLDRLTLHERDLMFRTLFQHIGQDVRKHVMEQHPVAYAKLFDTIVTIEANSNRGLFLKVADNVVTEHGTVTLTHHLDANGELDPNFCRLLSAARDAKRDLICDTAKPTETEKRLARALEPFKGIEA
jgi:hypothetical protein